MRGPQRRKAKGMAWRKARRKVQQPKPWPPPYTQYQIVQAETLEDLLRQPGGWRG